MLKEPEYPMTFDSTLALISSTLIGLGALLAGLYQRNKLRTAQSWKQATGAIRKAEVIRDTGPDSSGYFVSVLYDYSVDGMPHQGRRVGFRSRAYIRKKSAQAVADRYPADASVAVFYDPEKPSDSVLVREYPDNVVLIVGGIGLLILAFVILVAHA
jgi:hypothetical protein